MASRLIINADDFGLTQGINRAITQLHEAGVLSSATLMASGAAFDDAIAIAQAHPTLGVGCHVVLTDGAPVSSAQSIPTLLGADGKTFRPSLVDFIQALLRGKIREDEIEREAMAQIEKLQRAGISVTHIDTHKHTHLFPAVSRPLLRVAQRCSITAIRNPFEPAFTHDLPHAAFKRRIQLTLLRTLGSRFTQHSQIQSADVLTTDGTLGISATGNVTPATLTEILAALPSGGTYEIVCHPGYNDADLGRVRTRLRSHREIEMHALLAAVPTILSQPNPPELIHYGNLSTRREDGQLPVRRERASNTVRSAGVL